MPPPHPAAVRMYTAAGSGLLAVQMSGPFVLGSTSTASNVGVRGLSSSTYIKPISTSTQGRRQTQSDIRQVSISIV
jgi:hypothetical protein